jgi:hypothetical protein
LFLRVWGSLGRRVGLARKIYVGEEVGYRTAQRAQSGTPYPPGQQLLVEATPWVTTGGGLDPLDFIAPNLAGTLPVVAATTPGTTLVADIRSLVQAYVSSGATTADLRLRLSNETLAAGDYDELVPGTITLQVTYRP